MNTILTLKDIDKSYGKQQALHNISFTIKAGDIIGLIGENGAGKSTLIDIMAGIVRADAGEITIAGQGAGFENIYETLSFVFDEPVFYPKLTGYQNLRLWSDDSEAISYYLEQVGLEANKNKQTQDYSLGMRQRLSLARSFMTWKRMMVMDEPFNGLDPTILSKVKKMLQQGAKQGKAVLVSSHALKELMFFCNRFIFLHEGNIVALLSGKEHAFPSYDAYGDSNDKALLEALEKNHMDYVKIPVLQGVYFKNDEDLPHGLSYQKIEAGTNVLEVIYMQMKKLHEKQGEAK